MPQAKLKKTSGGFTLIEVLVYLGLLALVLAGLLLSAFGVFTGATRTQTKVMTQEEGNFLLAKINAGIAGSTGITLPASGGTGNTLVFVKNGNTYTISLSGGNLTWQENSDPAMVLNNANVTVTSGSTIFSHAGTGSDPEFVKAEFTLATKTDRGQDYTQVFSTTKFLRK